MRKVFSNSEVAHVFASRAQDEGKSSNIFFNRHTIYSYGYHFPMASFADDGKTVFFTTRGYSSSTSKHLNYTRHALNHFDMIFCANPEEARKGVHNQNLTWFNAMSHAQASSLKNARKPEKYFSEIAHQRDMFEKYCAFVGIKITKKLKNEFPFVFIESMDQSANAIRVRERFEKNKVKLAQARERKNHEENLQKFRSFEISRMYTRFTLTDYLRYNSETKEVQTSQGISIDESEARKLFGIVQSTVERGGCTDCGITIKDLYTVKSIDKDFLVVGCHTIPMSEILAIGKILLGSK